MAVLVHDFRERDGHRVVEKPLGREHPPHGAGKAVPLARHEIEVEPEQRREEHDETAREKDIRERHGARKERIGPKQRQPEEKVVMQQILVPGVPRCVQSPGERLAGDDACRRQELVVREECDQLLHLVKRGP